LARVRLNQTQDLPEEHRWLFERIGQRGGLLNIFRALSHSPVALRGFMRFGSYFLEEGKLDPKLRELAILRVGRLCRSPYEVAQHVGFARRVGLSDEQIRRIDAPDAGPYDAQQRAVIDYAGELTAEARVSDETYAAVAVFLDEERIVELTLVAGYYNLVSRALNALEVEVDSAAAKDFAEIGFPE